MSLQQGNARPARPVFGPASHHLRLIDTGCCPVRKPANSGTQLQLKPLAWNQPAFKPLGIGDGEGDVTMLRSGLTPPIVPYGADQTVYRVVEASEPERLSRRTAVERSDLETIITDLMSGRFDNPVGILAFNTLDHWADDLSKDVAREIQCRCDIEGDAIPDYLLDFVGNSMSRVDS
jgi:hypothetical protein